MNETFSKKSSVSQLFKLGIYFPIETTLYMVVVPQPGHSIINGYLAHNMMELYWESARGEGSRPCRHVSFIGMRLAPGDVLKGKLFYLPFLGF